MTINTDLTTDVGMVRAEIGDDTDGQGVKPLGANLSDAYIAALLTREGSVGGATAAACESLARAWSAYAGSRSMGPLSQSFQQAESWAAMAKAARAQYGGGGTSFAISMAREDGYSVNNPFVELEASEFADSRIVFVKL